MSNKALRILIADEQHFHRMSIERLFNQLDYHRIAPVTNLAELLTLVEYGANPFDLVVVDASLTDDQLDLPDFFLDNPQVRHVFIYNCPHAPPTACARLKVHASPLTLPDLASIQQLMASIETRLPFVGTVISVR